MKKPDTTPSDRGEWKSQFPEDTLDLDRLGIPGTIDHVRLGTLQLTDPFEGEVAAISPKNSRGSQELEPERYTDAKNTKKIMSVAAAISSMFLALGGQVGVNAESNPVQDIAYAMNGGVEQTVKDEVDYEMWMRAWEDPQVVVEPQITEVDEYFVGLDGVSEYVDEFYKRGLEQRVDPRLLAVICMRETICGELVQESHAGARGLMQITQPTVDSVRRWNPSLRPYDANDEALNIEYAANIINMHREWVHAATESNLSSHPIIDAISYNAGPGYSIDFLEANLSAIESMTAAEFTEAYTNGDLKGIGKIPSETEGYIAFVDKYY